MGAGLIQLRNRTEFSFKTSYGKIDNVLETNQGAAAAICDRAGTWGHVQWEKQCNKRKIKAIFGVELAFVANMDEREKQGINYMAFLAKNSNGLREIYELVTLATEKFYYEPRLDYSVLETISDDVIILSGNNPVWDRLPTRDNLYVELSPASQINAREIAKEKGLKVVATSDNYFCIPDDRAAYEMVVGRNADDKATPQHILSEWEWRLSWDDDEAVQNSHKIAAMCNTALPQASMVEPEKPETLRQMCEGAAVRKNINLNDPTYKQRLDRELGLIKHKNFEDYFYVVSDLCRYAKENMLVGPARGSSCGSLVCYLLDITEIDPIPYDLLFERFIDINRMDYPDIDIDFPDDRRDMVFDYLKNKYGGENVARLGVVSRFKAKSTITDVSKALRIPAWEVSDLKDAIIERPQGDARASSCILDAFESSDISRKVLEKYPELNVCSQIEGHARHTGQHAAGILVTSQPVSWYCSVDEQTGVAQIDKYDAERLNLLKIDALGLRTLSVMQDTLDQIGWSREQLINYRTDDEKAFGVLNNEQYAGLFQFEGHALQSLCKQLTIETFEDIASLTALARPGPLNSGGAKQFLMRRTGKSPVEYLHELTKGITEVTYGVIVYQEQVMQIARELGGLSWEDVSSLRKAMSKSLGKEYFDGFWDKFKVGAKENGIDEESARKIWDTMNTMGSWAFNRSHAVAYGMMSYWSCVLKAHFPLEFAAACLRNAKDEEQSIKILRELHQEGYEYLPYDKNKSQINWSVQDGTLIGGLMGIKGIGIKTAEAIIKKRDEGKGLTPRQNVLLSTGVTPYDVIFEAKKKWGHIYRNPQDYGINSELVNLKDIKLDSDGQFVFIAKLTAKNTKDHNEYQNIEKRGGKLMTGQTLYLDLTVEDDTAQIILSVSRYDYLRLGLPIVEEGNIGDWYIWKGIQRGGFRRINLKRYKKLTGNPLFDDKGDDLLEVIS